MPWRLRAKQLLQPRPRALRRAEAKRGKQRVALSQYQSLLAVRLNAFMSGRPFSPYWTYQLQSEISDLPIGTHVFTAWGATLDGDMQWSVVSPVGRHSDGGPLADPPSAKEALNDRITIPKDTARSDQWNRVSTNIAHHHLR